MTITTRDRVVASSLAVGGGTFDADGYSVEQGTAVTVAVLDKVSAADLALAVYNFAPFITEGNYLGTWYDAENDVWEVSETAVFANRADALRLAEVLAERYVFDIDTQECVAVA